MRRLSSGNDAKFQDVADTATVEFIAHRAADEARIAIVGTGTGTVQPVLQGGNEDHQSYTVSDDSIILVIPALEAVKITATGGAVKAQVVFYQET